MDSQIPIPIAIIGIGCRFPGGASPTELWDTLANGKSAYRDVPSSRYNWKSFYHPNQDASGAHNARGGHFLDQDISEFDANFFGIPASEASAIDPQQRLHLETAYEALENAGIPIENVRGSETSVYVAVVSRDYDRNIYKDPSDIPKYHLTGCGDATACGRISYVFDFKGPSMTIDTGCSGSMVGLHLACQSLRSGESTMALVGGTNLLLSPDMTIAMSMLHMLNDDGKCYSFDSRGSGYGRSEGVATIVLKRLDDALRDGDPIRAVIRNSGVNSDGKTNGILLPSLISQENLIKSMFKSAGLDPHEVGYVEAHGTGTVAGDSTELTSINNSFCSDNRRTPLYVGSIKANIGHPESSSGLAGVIKTCLALEKGYIPPVPGIRQLKDSLHLDGGTIKIPQKLEPWPTQGVRHACINSFGFGGTNSHVILSQTPRRHHQTSGISHANGISSHVNSANESTSKSIPRLFVLSAKSKISLIAAAANLREWLSQSLEDTNLQNLAYTLSNRRSLMAYRSAFLASSAESLHDVLQTCRITKVSSSLKIAWVFTGQGAQWPKMAQELIYNQTFGKSLTRSESILRSLGTTWSLIEEIQKEESQSRINESEISQPATTAIQIALIDLLRSFNVIPDAVLGHSSGEIAAAYGAGSLDQETALKISYHRSFISTWCREDVKQKGAMLAVGLGEDDVALHISKLQSGSCVVACVNSPSSTTVSGDQTAINELQQNLDQFSIFNRRLKVDTAYHSHHMRIVANRYLRSLGTIKTATRIDSIKFFSSVTGTEKLKGFEASYWVENLVSKVRFNDALQALAKSQSSDLLSTHIYIELGPHSALQGPIRQSLAELSLDLSRHLYYPTLVRDKHAQNSLLELAGKLYEQGYSIDLQAANTVGGAADIGLDVIYNLPSYAWNREKYWHESRLSREYRFREHPHHDLLGLRIAGGNILEPMWRNVLSIDTLPWLNEHIIDNFALFPGSGFLCMAIEAMRQILHDRKSTKTVRRFVMRDISFSKALVIPNSPGKIEVQLSFKQVSGSEDKSRTPWEEFCVTGLSQDGKTWNEHCRGSIMCELISTLPVQNAVQDDDFAETEYQDEEDFSTAEARLKLAKMQQNCVQNIDSASLYQELRENGIDYGNTFASISKLHIGPCQAIGTVVIPDIAACMPSNYFQPHVIHPATFDALMHIVLPLYSRHCSTGPVMLTSIEEVTVAADIFRTPGQELLVSCALSPAGTRSGTVNVSVFHGSEASETGPAVVTLTREEFRGLGSSASLSKNQILPKDIAYHVDWIAIPGYPADPDHSFNPIVIVQDTVDSSNGFASVISSIFQGFDIESTQVTLSSVDIEQGTTYLVIDTAPKPLLADPSLAQFSQINKIFSEAQLVIWTTVSDSYSTREIPENELIRGLARVARQEHKKLELFTLEIRSDLQDMPQLANVILNLVSTLSSWSRSGKSPLMDHDYIYSEGTLSVPRIVLNNCYNSFAAGKAENETFGMDLFHQEKRPLRIHVETPGLLESLQFVDDPDAIGEELCANVVAIKVYAHGVNQSDVSLALGRNGSQMIGECSGVITAMGVGVVGHRVGDRVLGWGSSSPYGSNMRMDYRLIHKLPESLSFIEGASIPYAFETAYYGLIEIANLQSGQSILIHSAAGGVGQAAIMLAKNIGAEIFLTVSSSNKRGMLAKTFGIPKKNIFSSRSKSFKQGIKRSTNGKGVDVVLNTITDSEMLHDTWECVSTFGTFINIAALAGQLSVKPFTSNVTFSSINMSLMAKHQPAKVGRILEKVMFMFEAKVLWPIHPIISMPMTQVVDAFKLIQYKKHNGKVVLTTDNSTMVKQTLLQTMSFQLEKSGNYVIAASDRQMVHPICRFMVAHGAEHIIVLVDSQDKKSALKIELDSFGANIRTLICDTTHQKRLKATIAGLGSIKGVVKVGSIECGGKSPLNAYEFQLPIDGTRFLAEALSESAIDFFIMISPISMALGLTNHGGYAAETAFQQAFAKSHVSSLTSFISLSIGCIETSGSHKFNDYAPKISIDEFNSLLEYSMGGKARLDGCHQILTGLDEASLRRHNLTTMDNPIFTSLQAATVSKPSRAIDSTKMTGQHLSMAKSVDEAQTMIAAALVEQLSSLVALDIEDITMNLPIADIGLDSLIAIEFKNWIGRNLSAAMQTSEILDAPNVGELAKLITSRSANVSNKLPKKCPEVDISEMGFLGSRSEQQNDAGHTTPPQSTSDQSIILTPISTTPSPMLKLPHQPLPELHSTLQFYLGSVRSFCSTKELEHTQSAIDEFLEPGGLGRLLQERLLTRYNDPNIQNWVAELYLASGFLERRVQLVPFSSFFFGHPHSEHPHTQAERATVISIAAFKYKQLLDGGQIQSEILNEQPTCMELYQWIFNTSRRPCIGVDVMDKFPGNDYLIALKNGRAFKVALTNGSGHVSYRELKVVFETILDTVDDSVSWAGILTSDERNSWAKLREQIKEVDKDNEAYIYTIEAACFVVCLDNASPNTAVERAAHFHFGDGSNRWNDKSIQFVVCANGVSGFIGEHTMLDAGTVHGLNSFINNAILNHVPDVEINENFSAKTSAFEELPFTATPIIESNISRVKQQFNESIKNIEHAFFTYTDFGGALMREHKCAPKSAFQIIVLLAAQDHFGYVPALWETVSVSNFHQGRIDINQIVLPPVSDFCAVFRNLSVPVSVRRKLFFEAIKAHANSVTRASRGRGIDRHLSALRQVLKAGEPLPALYKDPIYNKTRPRKIMSHCHETGMLEKGFVLRDPEAVWVHYELEDDQVRFAVTGTTGNTQAFCDLVQRNAGLIRELLTSK